MAFNNYTILWSPSFKEELNKIYEYIAFKLKEPIIARKFYQEIIGSLNTLKTFPERYPKLLLNNNKDIRKIHFKNYIIIYSINYLNQQVYILHIFHDSQNYFNQL